MSVPNPIPLNHPATRKITEEWVTLTPTLAEKWLGKNHGNRSLRPSKVRTFARDMRNGLWEITNQSIGFDYEGVLIDGQHRCEAVIESGVSIRVLVVRGLDPKARAVIDTGSKRTPADALRFSRHSVNATVLGAVARLAIYREDGGIRTATSGAAPYISNPEIVEWVDAHPEIETAVALARLTARQQIGINMSVWAYCLYEMQKINPLLANEFAMSMHEIRGLDGKGDPRVALMTAFRNAQAGRRRIPSAAETIYIVFRAWNAWVTGKRLTSVVPRNNDGKGNDIPKLASPTQAVRDRYYA